MKCSYDARGNLSELYFKAPGEEITYGWRYDAENQPVAYYENGNLVDGYYCELDAQGRVVKEDFRGEDGVNYCYEYSYDANGNIAHMIENKGEGGRTAYTYSYDELGRIIKEVVGWPDNAESNYYYYEYAEDGNYVVTNTYGTSEEEAETMKKTSFELDEQGRVVKESYKYVCQDEEGATLTSYDENGRVKELCKTRSTYFYDYATGEYVYFGEWYKDVYKYTYDGEGRIISSLEEYYASELDAEGQRSYIFQYSNQDKYDFDSAGRLVKHGTYYHAANKGETGEVVIVPNGAREYTYEYDTAGRLIKEVDTQYVADSYSGETNVSSVREYVYVYDAQGRLVKDYMKETDGNGNGISYVENYVGYDEQGRVTAMKDSGDGNCIQTWTYQYDSSGNITYEAYTQNDRGTVQSYEIKNTYDYKGQLAKMVYTDNLGNTITEVYYYNNLGQLYYYTTTQNTSYSTTTISYNAESLPLQSVTKSSTDGTTITCDYTYVQIPKTETDANVAVLIEQIMGLL